jgi:xylulose-5-phosphate/fructose-6-phosphate phosphoketolase
VHGYREEGTTTTPFDMTVLNELDRFHLALAVVNRVPALAARAPAVRERVAHKLREHAAHIRRCGDDLPEIRHWTWPLA